MHLAKHGCLGLALMVLTTLGCKRGAENATPEDICERGAARPEQKNAPPLAKDACVHHFQEMQKGNAPGFACTRRCIYANESLEANSQCTSLCTSNPDFVCPGLREQSKSGSADEIAQKIETCRSRRKAFLNEKAPETFQCVANCSAKANDLAEIEDCWTKSCKP